jgi:UDP-N-acetylmuramyl pentapeptide phosphotransferase/UDP-N-acetylglucosamine-1-phosphate transferase
MNTKHEDPSMGGILLVFATLVNVIILEKGITMGERWYFFLLITVPMYIMTVMDIHWKTPSGH